jgi:GNAT superfamily N-acetyltransferase
MKIHMKAQLNSLAHYSEQVLPLESFELDDIAELLYLSYENTTDWVEGSTHDDARIAIADGYVGKYGEYQANSSGLLLGNNLTPASGILCSVLEGMPFIVFTFTHPSFTKHGLATQLIKHAAFQFYENGHQEIHLYVTRGNPAIHLYRKLGFQEF